jgi:hypothetical protein
MRNTNRRESDANQKNQSLIIRDNGGDAMTFGDEQWRHAWEQEIRRRLDRLERGESCLLDWDDALADIRQSLTVCGAEKDQFGGRTNE